MQIFCAILAIVLGIGLGIHHIARKRKSRDSALWAPLLFVGTLLICSGSYYLFDRYWLSRIFYYPGVRIKEKPVYRPGLHFEKLEELVHKSWSDLSMPGRGVQDPLLRGKKHGGNYRILFIGSSQTFGEGATLQKETWPEVFLQRLNKLGEKVRFVGTNIALPGARSPALLSRYRNEVQKNSYDLVVLNLGTNDEYHASFREWIHTFAWEFAKAGSDILFVLEPNSIEDDDEFLRLKHEMMFDIASKFQLPVLDMHRYFQEPRVYESGMIWWDHVHLTSYGQELFANRLLEFFQNIPRYHKENE